MTAALQWRFMSLREARRTRKGQIGLKDATAVEALRRVEAEEEKSEGIDAILKAHAPRRLKKIRSWCRRQARHRRREAAVRQAPAGITGSKR